MMGLNYLLVGPYWYGRISYYLIVCKVRVFMVCPSYYHKPVPTDHTSIPVRCRLRYGSIMCGFYMYSKAYTKTMM